MTVQIADYDRVHIQLVTAHLRKAGLAVTAAFDALQAFSLALLSQPAAILLDVSMAGGTSIEVLKRMKNSSKTNQLPASVVSGSIDEKAGDVVKALGMEEYLRKPADLDELVRAIHRLLGTPIEVLTETQK